jgi:hypothetical protein
VNLRDDPTEVSRRSDIAGQELPTNTVSVATTSGDSGDDDDAELFSSMPKSKGFIVSPVLAIEIEDMTKETDTEYNEMKSRGCKSLDEDLYYASASSAWSHANRDSISYADDKSQNDKFSSYTSVAQLSKIESLAHKYDDSIYYGTNCSPNRRGLLSKREFDNYLFDSENGIDRDKKHSHIGRIEKENPVFQSDVDIPETSDYICDDENSCFGFGDD